MPPFGWTNREIGLSRLDCDEVRRGPSDIGQMQVEWGEYEDVRIKTS